MSQEYALISLPESKQRVTLPLVIGTTSDADVIINSGTFDDPVVVHSRDGVLQGKHLRSGRSFELKGTQSVQIRILGPLKETAIKPLRLWRESLVREKDFVSRLPKLLRIVLGASFPSTYRIGLALASVALAFVALSSEPASTATPTDLSAKPVPLPFDTLVRGPFGASFKRKGYEKGVRFRLSLPEEARGQSALLAFSEAGMNYGGEIAVSIGGQELYQSNVDAACVKNFCERQVRIPEELLLGEKIDIQFRHQPENSSWFIAELLFVTTPAISPVEEQLASRWFAVAERAFSERDINPGNLVIVRGEIARIQDLLRRRVGGDDIGIRASALLAEANTAFTTITRDLWAKSEVATKLRRYDEALEIFRLLTRLYPDSTSAEYRRIQMKTKRLRELMQ